MVYFSVSRIIPIFRERAHETLEQTIARKRKESFALLNVYAHLANQYEDFLEEKYGRNAPETRPYGFAGEESSFRAWSSREWVDMYYRYNPMHTEKHRHSSEHYRQEIQDLYEKKLKELNVKMSSPEYLAFAQRHRKPAY